MGCASTLRGIRLATGAAIYRLRSGLCLWRCLYPSRSRDGHSGPADRTTIAMAERTCGEAYRFDPTGLKGAMELRHLRYFVAVAEAGSLTVAAEKRLHTAQPSLSRQIRDLEYEVGVQLMSRSVHGIELTAAGRAFLDHARLALTQAEAAAEAARRAAQPVMPTFAIAFLTGP